MLENKGPYACCLEGRLLDAYWTVTLKFVGGAGTLALELGRYAPAVHGPKIGRGVPIMSELSALRLRLDRLIAFPITAEDGLGTPEPLSPKFVGIEELASWPVSDCQALKNGE